MRIGLNVKNAHLTILKIKTLTTHPLGVVVTAETEQPLSQSLCDI